MEPRSNFGIRELNKSSVKERKQVLELIYESQRTQHVELDHRDTPEQSRSNAQHIWRRNLAGNTMIYYVAVMEEKVVGYVLLRRMPDKTGFIDDLGVHEHYRHQGIGTKLVEYGLEWARASGLSAMKLTTQRVNAAAAATYQAAGFKQIDSEYIDFELKF